MPTPEEYAAERLAARAATYSSQVDRLRALCDPADESGTEPTTEENR